MERRVAHQEPAKYASPNAPLAIDSHEKCDYTEADTEASLAVVESPLPVPQMPILLLLNFIEPLTATTIFPIVAEATRLSGVTSDEKALGYYAGLIEGIFFLCEAGTVLQWGRLSDRIGRRPVLAIGMAGSALSMTLFGLSTSFTSLITSRAICGLLNGNVGVLKSCAAESLDETNEARGFGLVSTSFQIALVFGPLLGGTLAHPDRLGGVFENDFWRTHPFALASFVVALICAGGACLARFGLRETLPRLANATYRPLPESVDYIGPEPLTPSSSATFTEEMEGSRPIPTLRELIGMSSVRASIWAYVHLAGCDIAYCAIIVLFCSTSVQNGGLDLSPAHIGIFLAASGGIAGLSQALFFARVVGRLGPKLTYRIAVVCYGAPFVLMPLASMAAQRGSDGLSIVMLILVTPFICIAEMAYSSTFLFLSSAGPRSAIATLNGLAQTAVSLIRSFGPMAASVLFAMTISHNLLGGHLVYIVFASWTLFASIVVGSWLPDQLRRERSDSDIQEMSARETQ